MPRKPFIPLVDRVVYLEKELQATQLQLQKLQFKVSVMLNHQIEKTNSVNKRITNDQKIRERFRKKLLKLQ
jgi:hypothetical protein